MGDQIRSSMVVMRQLGRMLLLAFMLEAVVALDAGRRGGAFLSSTGSFTLSSGSNTAGNDESLLFGEDLGEDVGATADDLDAAADHFLKLAGERKNKAKRKREAEQTAATSEVAELGDGAEGDGFEKPNIKAPAGYKRFRHGGRFVEMGAGAGHPLSKCGVKNFWAVFICNTKETKEGFHKGKRCGCSGRNVVTKYDMGVDTDPKMSLIMQKECQNKFWTLQTNTLTMAAGAYKDGGLAMTREGCTVAGPSSASSSTTSTMSANGMKNAIKKGIGGKAALKNTKNALLNAANKATKKPTGPCAYWCKHKKQCTNHRKQQCGGCSFC